MGEIGGGHATGGTAAQTSTSNFTLEIDQTKVPAGGSLVVGLEGGKSTGSGVTSVSLTVTVDGTVASALSFSGDSVAQATAAFDDKAYNLGSLAGTGTLDLSFALSVTGTAASSGFYGGFIVGDPPGAGGLHVGAELGAFGWALDTGLEGIHVLAV